MPKEQCYGVVVVYKENNENIFLILQHDDKEGSWSFPKGHTEDGETPKGTALRELEEEAGIKDVELLSSDLIYEEYPINRNEEKRLKINEYFIGFVNNKDVKIQEDEIHTFKWATYEEALGILTYSTRKESLKKAKEYLDMLP